MFDFDTWQEIFFTLRQNKLRTALTAFAVSWGIFMLMLLMGFGAGLKNGIDWGFRDDAINRVAFYAGRTSKAHAGLPRGKLVKFTNRDYDEFNRSIDGIEHITGRVTVDAQHVVRYQDQFSAFPLRGVHPEHLHIEKTILTSGRYLNQFDLDQSRKVAVIGPDVAELFFGEKDPLGKWIKIRNTMFQVIGTYWDEGGEFERTIIYLPLTTAQLLFRNSEPKLNHLIFTTGNASVADSKAMQVKAEEILRARHGYAEDDKRAVYVNNGLEQYQRVIGLTTAIHIVLWIVGLGTIIAGIVGVSNIMLIVVKERTKEIGLRKALGATPGSIIQLIMLESIFVTAMAGYVGLLFGVLLVEAVNWVLQQSGFDGPFQNPVIELNIGLVALALLVAAGAIAGFIPARKAAQVEPVNALRDE